MEVTTTIKTLMDKNYIVSNMQPKMMGFELVFKDSRQQTLMYSGNLFHIKVTA